MRLFIVWYNISTQIVGVVKKHSVYYERAEYLDRSYKNIKMEEKNS